MRAATAELLWVKSFLASLGVIHVKPMTLFCDSDAAMHIAKNPVFHDRTKHIEIDCHFIRHHLVNENITTKFVRSKEQRADLFTKALGIGPYTYLRSKLGIGDITIPT